MAIADNGSSSDSLTLDAAAIDCDEAAVVGIRCGLDAFQFEPFFQPIMHLADGSLVGFEALARWRHPQRGLVEPAEFVAIAEANGLIQAIDSAILDRSWHVLEAALEACPLSGSPMVLSVNLSAVNLLDDAILDRLSALYARGLGRRTRLQFEITETLLINDKEGAAAIMTRLKEMGVSFALDDFGTGHSSLVYLHRLPIDCIKIDRSFSEAILHSPRSRAIVRSIIGLARSMELRAVAEGVEEKEVADELLALDCKYGQGLYFGAPVPAGALVAALEQARAKQR
jgi:EAL domain-containing protein (putative c-di-GMP-specific phosphodiesterase class I)